MQCGGVYQGALPGWHLDNVQLNRVVTDEDGDEENYNFNCVQWFSRSEGDKEIVREMPAQGSIIPARDIIPYKVGQWTMEGVT